MSEFVTCDDWMVTNDLRNTCLGWNQYRHTLIIIFTNGWVFVKTCQMYLFTMMKHHAHSRSVRLEDCYNSNSQKISELEPTLRNCIQVESGKLLSKKAI